MRNQHPGVLIEFHALDDGLLDPQQGAP